MHCAPISSLPPPRPVSVRWASEVIREEASKRRARLASLDEGLGLAAAALPPTLVTILAFRFL